MAVGLFSACSKEYISGNYFYPDDFAVDIVNAYRVSSDAIKVDFEVSNLSNMDYFQGADGNYYLEFGILNNYGEEYFGEAPIGTLYAGEYARGSIIIRVDPRASYNLNSITYDIYDADRY